MASKNNNQSKQKSSNSKPPVEPESISEEDDDDCDSIDLDDDDDDYYDSDEDSDEYDKDFDEHVLFNSPKVQMLRHFLFSGTFEQCIKTSLSRNQSEGTSSSSKQSKASSGTQSKASSGTQSKSTSKESTASSQSKPKSNINKPKVEINLDEDNATVIGEKFGITGLSRKYNGGLYEYMDFECLNNCPTPANDHIWFNSSGGRTPIRQDMSYNNYNNWDTLTADQYRVYLGWEKLKTASHDKLLAHLKNALSPKTEATTSSGRTESASSETGVQESKKQKKRRKAKESVLKKKRADSAGGESETQCESKAATAKEEEVVDERTKLLREFESLVRKGTEHYVKAEYSACVDVYKRVRKHYSELLRNMCAPRDRAIFTYIFCMSRIHTRSYEEITDSLHELKMDLPAPFPIPMKHYGIALAYQTLNRHDMVVQNTRVALTAISEVKKNAPAPGGKEKDLSCNTGDPSSDEKCDFCMLTPIPESNPDHLTGLLESLARSIPSIPVARCKYERCLNISTHVLPSQLIFETDPDFTGYVRVICEDQCSIEYHHQCWKAYKESVTVDIGVKTSDKEFLGKSCPTLDCKTQYNKPSTIVKINIYGADNEIKSSQTKPAGVGVIAIGGTHSGHSRKRDEDTEEGDRGKKKRNRVDSESSPMRGKSKKKETRKGNKEKEGGKTLEEGGDAKSAAAAHQGEKVEEKIATPPPAPAAQPKKGKHRKVKFSCVESYNRPSNGPYKPGLPNQTKGATADKGKSWREKKSILGDLEAEVNLLEALRETKFGIPEEDWVDVSKDNFDNPQLVADKIHIDKYNRNPNDTEVLLFDMYRDYLKDSKQPVQILPPENRSHNFWNLSWTPGADIITNFDSIVISNKWKDVSRFLTSSPEFVIIDTDLCLVGHLHACVQLQIYDPDCSSEDEVLQYVHLTHEAVEKSSQDQQVLVQVQGVDETKIKNELALFGRVKQAVPYEAGFIVTFADKVGAAMAVKYSQREVKRICADPNHAACKAVAQSNTNMSQAVAQSNTNMSQAVAQSNTNMSHKALNPDAKIFGFDDMAAKAINTREYQSVECEEVASETESVSEITSDNEDLEDEDDDDGSVGEMLDETEDEDERYEGVDLSVFELSGCENKLEMNENELRENENELGIIEKQNESSEDENKLEMNENELSEDENKIENNENEVSEDENKHENNENELSEDENKLGVNENELSEDENKLEINENEHGEDENNDDVESKLEEENEELVINENESESETTSANGELQNTKSECIEDTKHNNHDDKRNLDVLDYTEIVKMSKEEDWCQESTKDTQKTTNGDLYTVVDNDLYAEEDPLSRHLEETKIEPESSEQEYDSLKNQNDVTSVNNATNEDMSDDVKREMEFVRSTMGNQSEGETLGKLDGKESLFFFEIDETDVDVDISVKHDSEVQEMNERTDHARLVESNIIPNNYESELMVKRVEDLINKGKANKARLENLEDLVNKEIDKFNKATVVNNSGTIVVNNDRYYTNESENDSNPEESIKSSMTDDGIENEHLLKLKDALQTLPNVDKTKTLNMIRNWLEHSVDESTETVGPHKEDLNSTETKPENEHLYKLKDAIQTLPNNDKTATLDMIKAWLDHSNKTVGTRYEREMEYLQEDEIVNDKIRTYYYDVPGTQDRDKFISSSRSSCDSNIEMELNRIETEFKIKPTTRECENSSNQPQSCATNNEPTPTKCDQSLPNDPHLLPPSCIEFTPWSNQYSSDESEYCDDFVEDIPEFEQENLTSDQNETPRNEHRVVDCTSRDAVVYRDETCTTLSSYCGLDDQSKISSLEKNMVLLEKQLAEMRKENLELKRTILESRKYHCDYILQGHSDQCLSKLDQWDVFRSTFTNETNKDNQIWSVLEKEETTWETRMRDSRLEADRVEDEYNSHLCSLDSRGDALTGDDLQFSLLTRSLNQLRLQDTSRSRYAQLYETALELNTSGELYQSAQDHQSDENNMDISLEASSNEDPAETSRTICLEETTPFDDLRTTLGSSLTKDNKETVENSCESDERSLYDIAKQIWPDLETAANVDAKDKTEAVGNQVKIDPKPISKQAKKVVGLSEELINDLDLVANNVLQPGHVSQPSNTTQPMFSSVPQPIRKALHANSSVSQSIASSVSQPKIDDVLQSVTSNVLQPINQSQPMTSHILKPSIASQPMTTSVSQPSITSQPITISVSQPTPDSVSQSLTSTMAPIGSPMISSTPPVFTNPPPPPAALNATPPGFNSSCWTPIVSTNNTWSPIMSTNNTWNPMVSSNNMWTNNSPRYVIAPPPGLVPVRFNPPMNPVMMNSWAPRPAMYPFPMPGQVVPMMSQPGPMTGPAPVNNTQQGPVPGSNTNNVQRGPIISQPSSQPAQASNNVQQGAQSSSSNDKQGMSCFMNPSGNATTNNYYPPNSVQGPSTNSATNNYYPPNSVQGSSTNSATNNYYPPNSVQGSSTNSSYSTNSYFGGPTLFSPRPTTFSPTPMIQPNTYSSSIGEKVSHVSGAPLYKTTEQAIEAKPLLEDTKPVIDSPLTKQPSLEEQKTSEVNLSQTGPSSQNKQTSLEDKKVPDTKPLLEENKTEVEDTSQTQAFMNANKIADIDVSQKVPSLNDQKSTEISLSKTSEINLPKTCDVKEKPQSNMKQVDIDYLRSVLKMNPPREEPNEDKATNQPQDSAKLMKDNSNTNGDASAAGSTIKPAPNSEEVSKFLKELFGKSINSEVTKATLPETTIEESKPSCAIKQAKTQSSDSNKENMGEQKKNKERVTNDVKKENTKLNAMTAEGQVKKNDKKEERKKSENLEALNSKVDTISRYLKDLLEESNKTPKTNKKGSAVVRKPEPGKKLRLSEILTDFSKLTDDPDEDNGPDIQLDFENEDYPRLGAKKKGDNLGKNKMMNQTARSRTVSLQSNDSVTSDKTDVTSKVKPVKPVQLVNTSVKPADAIKPSTSNETASGWTEVVRKKLGTSVTPGASYKPDLVWSESCTERLKKHLVACFPSVSAELMITMVKNIRREHGNRLSGLSFELIETLVRLQLAKKSSVGKTDSSLVGWEKFTGKAWADTKTQKTTEWNNAAKSSSEECIICMYELGVRTTTLDCKHVFHTQCIKQWLCVNSVCPMCKKYTTLKDDFPSLC